VSELCYRFIELCLGVCVVLVVAVKFILGTLGYIADVLEKTVGQENGTMEDGDASSLGDGEIVDSEVQELIDNTENVSVFYYSLKY